MALKATIKARAMLPGLPLGSGITASPGLKPAAPEFGVTWGLFSEGAEGAVTSSDKTSRTAKTNRAYVKRCKQLMKRFLRESPIHTDATAFVMWLISRKPSFSRVTWRQYKASVLAGLNEWITRLSTADLGQDASSAVVARIALIRGLLGLLEGEGSSGCVLATTSTSAGKSKGLSECDRVSINAALARSRSAYAEALSDYLSAALRTGLRPSEWANTAVILEADGTLILRVRNAKHSNGRAHGSYRTLRFTALPLEERSVILRFHKRVQDAGNDAAKLLKAISDLLYRITRDLWPRRKRHPTMYSCRHAFAALCKLTYELAEVAALMGHASDATATHHYGRRRAGGARTADIEALIDRLPRPAPDEVARVRRQWAREVEKLWEMREARVLPSAKP